LDTPFPVSFQNKSAQKVKSTHQILPAYPTSLPQYFCDEIQLISHFLILSLLFVIKIALKILTNPTPNLPNEFQKRMDFICVCHATFVRIIPHKFFSSQGLELRT